MEKQKSGFLSIENILFFILFILIFIFIIILLRPFFFIIIWSTVLSILISPIFNYILSIIKNLLNKLIIKNRKFEKFNSKIYFIVKCILGFIFCAAVFLLIVIPSFYFFSSFSKQLLNIGKDLLNFINKNPKLFSIEYYENFVDFLYEISNGLINLKTLNLKYELTNLIQKFSITVFENTTKIFNSLIKIIVNIFFIIFTLYFFLIDGEYLKNIFISSIPIKKDYIEIFVKKFKEVSKAIVNGYILVSLLQASIATLIFYIFKINNYLIWGFLVFLSTFIPIFGNAGVWIPLSLSKIFISGQAKDGILLAISCLIFVTILDYILRPILLRITLNLHPFLIFLAMLGGIYTFGLSGIILGPFIYILFFTVLDIFLELKHTNQN
ncbi:MAG: AI-2E family transporter [Spirochaetes bacterium]|nr:AI-2E family transporter [Spirochaetota bacterium]